MKLRRPLLIKISESVSELFTNIAYLQFEVTPKKEFSGQILRVIGVVDCVVHAEN
jgi:hypothetical protein